MKCYEDSKIVDEQYIKNDKPLMERGAGGIGRIWAEKQKQYLDFQTDESQLAVVARRDSVQHQFFEPLHAWGGSVYHYRFGTQFGRDHFAIPRSSPDKPDLDTKDQDKVVAIFLDGRKQYGQEFVDSIRSDMAALDYPLDDIDAAKPPGLRADPPIPIDSISILGIVVKEHDLPGLTGQIEMSQGMFRTFSLLIHLNHAQRSRQASCVLIDDIGEGLDFARSCKLIEIVMAKAQQQSLQLIMTTNDRFVMNNVPLETWTILKRHGPNIRVFNYQNSKHIFDEFKFTGLNNFDFLAMDFVNNQQDPQDAELADHEKDGDLR